MRTHEVDETRDARAEADDGRKDRDEAENARTHA
jgi:hypothetical protein